MAGKDNLRPPFSKNCPEIARENQQKAVESRKRNKKKKETVSEAVAQILSLEITDPRVLAKIKKSGLPVPEYPTWRDYIILQIMSNTAEKGKMKDLLDMAELLGENDAKEKDEGNEQEEINIHIVRE